MSYCLFHRQNIGVCFGQLAEGLTAIQKGSRVFVAGELESVSFSGDEGEKRMTFRVLANAYRVLGNGRSTAVGEISEEG